MSDICGVYIIKSLESGRVYIGSSKRVRARIARHVKLLNNRKHHNDDMIGEWEKFGEDSFEFSLIEECNEDMLRVREFMWCKKYDVFNPLNGFNKNLPVNIEATEPPHFLFNCNFALRTRCCSFKALIFFMFKMDKYNIFSLSSRDRKILASACSISLNTINIYISSMCGNDIISKLDNGCYIVNRTLCRWGVYEKLSVDDIHIRLTGLKYSEDSTDSNIKHLDTTSI